MNQSLSLNGAFSESTLTLMQYTGLKDINGVKIFEGDILHPTYNRLTPFTVEFKGGAFNACRFNHEACKIIGNIYENKELLK